MGVIKRFAIGSTVLGVLALAGGASALAFDGGSTAPGSRPASQQLQDRGGSASDAIVSDVPAASDSDVLPDTGGSDASARWFRPHGG
ncbi:hypothetical protein [Sporichthya polymorpha]|uniref:hypothetical protein n=1 Tax=Sporichthya polymorpha TaxID=35751 RepID=UPI0003771988|nr:hypothetical protein [Sporichthya polymorpha]